MACTQTQVVEEPDWAPDADDIAHARDVLDLAYFKRRHFRRSSDAEVNAADTTAADEEWRRKGEELLYHSPGAWNGTEPLYLCRNPAETRTESIEVMYNLVTSVIMHSYLSVPADNKWLSSFPLAQDVLLMTCFYGMMAWCEDHVNGSSKGTKKLSGKQCLDLPPDYAIDHDWATTRSAYHRRGAAFIHGPDVAARFCCYVSLLSPLMSMHYDLFKHGTRDQPTSRAMEGMDTKAGSPFNFADMSRSPAVKHYVRVCAFLIGGFWDASTHAAWRPIMRFAGCPSTWSNDLWYGVRESLL